MGVYILHVAGQTAERFSMRFDRFELWVWGVWCGFRLVPIGHNSCCVLLRQES